MSSSSKRGGQEGAGVRQRTKKEDNGVGSKKSGKKEGAPGEASSSRTEKPQQQPQKNSSGGGSGNATSVATLPVRAKAQLLLAPEGNREAFTKLMYATAAMILLPVLTYFFAYHVVPPAFGMTWSENMKAVVAGVSAVAMVQTIIIGYVLSAFRE